MRRWPENRIVLGPRVVPFVAATALLFVVLVILVAPYLKPIARGAGRSMGTAVLWGVLALAGALAYSLRSFMGFAVELDGAQLCIRPYGYCWRAHRFPLSVVKCVEPWRDDLREDVGTYDQERGHPRKMSPRLHVQFQDGSGRLFGPWVTRDAQHDFDRLSVILGGLFGGDSQLQIVTAVAVDDSDSI